MRWNKYTIATTTAAVDLISSALNDCGIEGIEIEDNVQLSRDEIKTMFVDFIRLMTVRQKSAFILTRTLIMTPCLRQL